MIITDAWGDRWSVSLTERQDVADPANIEPLHEVRDAGKLEALVASMERDGWQGRPLLVSARDGRFFAYTGSHRIAAARAAGLDRVPVVIIEIDETRTDDEPDDDDEIPAPEYDAYGRIELGSDDDDRLEALRAWSLPMSLGLIEQEVAQN